MSSMEYTMLEGTGVEVSSLCLGTAAFSYADGPDWTIRDRRTCLDVVDRAIDAGVNFLDTANIYGGGESEELVGEAIDGRRDDLVVASKVGKSVGEGPNVRGLSRKHVLEQCEATLDRLGTDYLDLYYIHQWDPRTPLSETLSALDALVEEGKVRYLGASNLAAWQLAQALERSDREGFERFACVQPEYNLVARHEEQNLLPVAADQGLAVASYAPLAAGFLTGMYDRETGADVLDAGDETYRDLGLYADADRWAVLDVVRDLAERKDATPVQVSVAWLLESDRVTVPIIGPRTVDQFEEYLGALEVSLTDEEVSRLEEPIDPVWHESTINWDWSDTPFDLR
jgi:aryl-alcohol dehydrogenase-like predicted oxidoreductase